MDATAGDHTIKGALPETYDGSNLKIGIVHARWNKAIIDNLLLGIRKALESCGVQDGNVTVQSVPGSWELPVVASEWVRTSSFDAIIAVGVLIKGETMHFEYIADAVSQGLMRAQERSSARGDGIPVTFGVLTVMTEDQARARAGMTVGGHNHGEDWGLAAVEMGLKRKSHFLNGSIATLSK